MSYDLNDKIRAIIESVENQCTRAGKECEKSAKKQDAVSLLYWQGKREAYSFVLLKLHEASGYTYETLMK